MSSRVEKNSVPPAPIPANELERLSALRSYEILDTASETAFNDIATLAARLTGTPIALISLIDAERQWFKARVGLDASEVPREQSFCSHAILGSDPMVVDDLCADARFADNPLVCGPPNLRFYAGVPMVNTDGLALGSLCVIDRERRDMPPEQRETLAALARTAMTTLELHRAMRQVRRLAMTDALTGLANRPALLEALDRAVARLRRHEDVFALVYVDLDGFKRVNDMFGHAAGDRALREAADALRSVARREDVAARIGGDELAVLMAACDEGEMATVTERLRQAVAERMTALNWPITASVGAVRFLAPPEDIGHALLLADANMYAAKMAGKNRVVATEHGPAEMIATRHWRAAGI